MSLRDGITCIIPKTSGNLADKSWLLGVIVKSSKSPAAGQLHQIANVSFLEMTFVIATLIKELKGKRKKLRIKG